MGSSTQMGAREMRAVQLQRESKPIKGRVLGHGRTLFELMPKGENEESSDSWASGDELEYERNLEEESNEEFERSLEVAKQQENPFTLQQLIEKGKRQGRNAEVLATARAVLDVMIPKYE